MIPVSAATIYHRYLDPMNAAPTKLMIAPRYKVIRRSHYSLTQLRFGEAMPRRVVDTIDFALRAHGDYADAGSSATMRSRSIG